MLVAPQRLPRRLGRRRPAAGPLARKVPGIREDYPAQTSGHPKPLAGVADGDATDLRECLRKRPLSRPQRRRPTSRRSLKVAPGPAVDWHGRVAEEKAARCGPHSPRQLQGCGWYPLRKTNPCPVSAQASTTRSRPGASSSHFLLGTLMGLISSLSMATTRSWISASSAEAKRMYRLVISSPECSGRCRRLMASPAVHQKLHGQSIPQKMGMHPPCARRLAQLPHYAMPGPGPCRASTESSGASFRSVVRRR